VVQETAVRITYWHVECARHEVLLAEGLPAESYLDTGNRGAFAPPTPLERQGVRIGFDTFSFRRADLDKVA
jgi:hypothetical protein